MIAALLGLAVASCGGHPAPGTSAPPAVSLNVKACTVGGQAARCGTLIVPEDWLTGTGRTIPVRFVVIPATGPDKAPDPVVYFAGGPGDSAVNQYPGGVPDLAYLNVHRDLVFIEQRGTGSSNPLNCPIFAGSLADKPAMRASIESCLAGLHGDLRFYTTAMYVDDVNQVLGDLHYAKANFIGISYGTDAEQVFLLRHPARVRTMTLLSGSPLNVRLFNFQPGNAQLALDYVFARCQASPSCHRAFPHLAADWSALWASVGRSPWVIPAAQSPAKTTVRLDQDALADSVYNAMYTGNIGPIPRGGPYPGRGQEQGGRPGLSDQRVSGIGPDLESAQLMQFICPLIPKSAAAVGQEQSTWDLCAGPLTRTFIEQASLAHLNTNCLADIPAPVFDLTLP